MLDVHVHRAATGGVGQVVAFVRLRDVVVGVEHVLALGQGGDRVEVVLVRTAGVGADDQFVFLAEGVEFAVDVGIEAVVAWS